MLNLAFHHALMAAQWKLCTAQDPTILGYIMPNFPLPLRQFVLCLFESSCLGTALTAASAGGLQEQVFSAELEIAARGCWP